VLRKREKKVESLYSRLLPSAQHIYVHLYSVHCKVYMYIIDIEHQDFLRALEASRCTLIPTLGLRSEYPTCSVCVCVCSHTHTHTAHTHESRTHTQHIRLDPLFKMRRRFLTLAQTNPFLRHAGFKRKLWGRGVCCSLMQAAGSAHTLAHTHTHTHRHTRTRAYVHILTLVPWHALAKSIYHAHTRTRGQ